MFPVGWQSGLMQYNTAGSNPAPTSKKQGRPINDLEIGNPFPPLETNAEVKRISSTLYTANVVTGAAPAKSAAKI